MNAKDYKIVCRIIMYDKIQSLRNEEHKSIQWIADHLGVNFRTVKKYLEMTRDEFETFSNKVVNKPHLLALYKSFIVERLTKYPDTPAAQMHDWLKEHYPDFPKVSPKTVYNYVMKLRSDYNLPKVSEPNRQYSANEFKSFITFAKRVETADVKPETKPLGDESANLLSKVERKHTVNHVLQG